jgi:hypothetical protein
MKSSPSIEKTLHEFSLTGKILPRTENNKYLKVSYKGNGSDISEKWNVKIYTSGSIVTTDTKTLKDIINGTFQAPDTSLKVIQIDDAGFGSPVCGVMIGVTDGNELWTDTVDVKLFQGDAYEKREYLKDYTEKGLAIITKQGISPKIHRIEICSGFINQMLKEKLRERGFNVVITDIKGKLQDFLELLYKDHVKQLTGHDLGYDPKELSTKQIANKYYTTVAWARKNAPHLLKTGWKALR